MPRENSFSDSDGRSLTPDLEDEANPFPPASPTYASPKASKFPDLHTVRTRESVASRTASRAARTRPIAPALHPRERFRHVVRKVIAMHRGTTIMARRGAGAEPGVDPRRASADAEYGGIKQQCVIELVDYSAVRTSFGRMTNREFVEYMNDSKASAREPWIKVRWINIGGLSWDVLKALSIKYDLHPLALEDLFHAQARARSKADYYPRHLFLRILCHELGESDEPYPDSNPILAGLPRSESPTEFETPGGENPRRTSGRKRHSVLPATRPNFPHTSLAEELTAMQTAAVQEGDQRRIQDAALTALKSEERVNVTVSPMFIFLFRDGTVISIHSTPSLEMTEPIKSRLRQFDTGLRTSADPSLLVQSLLSLVTDKALEVIEAYKDKIKKFERQIMLKSTIQTVRNLHILSGDLILHRRTLSPLKTVIYGLRRYDVDRVAALIDSSAEENKDVKVVGFMSHNSKTYLADVNDHIDYVLSQLDVIANIGQNLVDYSFNMTSYEMNEVMRRLMIVTVIFLPLTLLTGYFGMNFTFMWSVHDDNHSDLVFWIIALPIMAIIIPLFTAPDIKRVVHYAKKRHLTKQVVESAKST